MASSVMNCGSVNPSDFQLFSLVNLWQAIVHEIPRLQGHSPAKYRSKFKSQKEKRICSKSSRYAQIVLDATRTLFHHARKSSSTMLSHNIIQVQSVSTSDPLVPMHRYEFFQSRSYMQQLRPTLRPKIHIDKTTYTHHISGDQKAGTIAHLAHSVPLEESRLSAHIFLSPYSSSGRSLISFIFSVDETSGLSLGPRGSLEALISS